MSNILIIKHGSLGDIAQISGAIQDIKENHQQDKVFLLTTSSYENLFNKCPYIDKVYVDQRLSRLNLFYLLKLKKMLTKLSLSKVYDLQNSSRTSFYRKYLLRKISWSSTETTLPLGKTKRDFDACYDEKMPVEGRTTPQFVICITIKFFTHSSI